MIHQNKGRYIQLGGNTLAGDPVEKEEETSIIVNALYEEDESLYRIADQGPWIDDGKYARRTTIFQETCGEQAYWRFSGEWRSGSSFTEYTYWNDMQDTVSLVRVHIQTRVLNIWEDWRPQRPPYPVMTETEFRNAAQGQFVPLADAAHRPIFRDPDIRQDYGPPPLAVPLNPGLDRGYESLQEDDPDAPN